MGALGGVTDGPGTDGNPRTDGWRGVASVLGEFGRGYGRVVPTPAHEPLFSGGGGASPDRALIRAARCVALVASSVTYVRTFPPPLHQRLAINAAQRSR